MQYKLGIDIGGTFTDFFLVDDAGHALMHKTLSTPEDSSVGFITGIREVAEKVGRPLDAFVDDIDTIVHGTTVATNALLTLGGARTALITTKGFRDALEMRRGIREEQYNNRYTNAKPLVPRYLRLCVDERTDAEGNVLNALDTGELDQYIMKIREEQVESVAVCFMNSYLNAGNEREAVRYLRAQLPGVFVTGSYEVLPSVRFYERISTTCVNAYIGPVVDHYLASLLDKLDELHFKGKLLIMQSNGGVVTPEVARKIAAVTVLSGPAAAPIAGAYFARMLRQDKCITMDMGGTSFDASMVVNGQCVTSTEGAINRYRVALPTLDIVTIGAGGGSIGWIDSGGMLRMGPGSAGSLPGPVSYDRGGEDPACTDADLLLGYLDPLFFAGGKYPLNKEKADAFTEKQLGKALNLDTVKTAAGMYRVINMNMAQGVRQVSVERGYDPREFLMICAGGAGSIHAGEICRELEIPMFIVPDVAPIFCAAGMLLGDLKHDYVRSYMSSFDHIDKELFLNMFDEMTAEAEETLVSEGISNEKIRFCPILDLRYEGQYHEVQLETTQEAVKSFDLVGIAEAFHQEHNRQFGYALKEEQTPLEVINLRLMAIGETEKPASIGGREALKNNDISAAIKGKRMIYVPETDEMQTSTVYDGSRLSPGMQLEGPAVIEEVNTTLVLGLSYTCRCIETAYVVYNHQIIPEGPEL